MCLCLSTLASTVWKKNCLFIYNVQSWKKVGVIFPVILGRFSFASHATSFFIHSLSSFFFKCLHVAVFLYSGVIFANIRHDPRNEYNRRKSECSELQWSWGVWGCSEIPAGVLGGGTP